MRLSDMPSLQHSDITSLQHTSRHQSEMPLCLSRLSFASFVGSVVRSPPPPPWGPGEWQRSPAAACRHYRRRSYVSVIGCHCIDNLLWCIVVWGNQQLQKNLHVFARAEFSEMFKHVQNMFFALVDFHKCSNMSRTWVSRARGNFRNVQTCSRNVHACSNMF